jgi:hypothetical protein
LGLWLLFHSDDFSQLGNGHQFGLVQHHGDGYQNKSSRIGYDSQENKLENPFQVLLSVFIVHASSRSFLIVFILPIASASIGCDNPAQLGTSIPGNFRTLSMMRASGSQDILSSAYSNEAHHVERFELYVF